MSIGVRVPHCSTALGLVVLWLVALVAVPAHAQEEKSEKSPSKFEQLTEKKKSADGMWKAYYDDQKLLVELSSSALKKDYIIIPSIARGISRGMVLGGMSWGFGDDIIWGFRKTDDKLFILQRNVRFRADPHSPEAEAVAMAYSDSILYSLPIQTKAPNGNIIVDMTSVFMNDELRIGDAIGPGFRFAQDRSTLDQVKMFDDNLELQVNAVYSGSMPIETVPNSRGVQVLVHYSISVLPSVGSDGYKPRLADDRVGYFVTAVKDFSKREIPDHFVRYVNRWNLQKLDPSINLSPPKEPIRFYIEDTVPVFLRPTVEAGIMEWNKAFEKLGFAGAIKVDQQPDDADFDPENIHYNTFRWMTAEAGFAMGPSRVDPRTGQILDADIIFDARFLDSWSQRWEAYRSDDDESNPLVAAIAERNLLQPGHQHSAVCRYSHEMQRQNGIAAAVFSAIGATENGALPEEFIHQGLKEVVMHEVGHTLGLRHNFKASSWKSLEQINDAKAGREQGTIASVMDYAPPNLLASKKDQGLYYSQTIGPYDYWAIEYGYKPISGDVEKELQKIAARSNEPELAYATDEDTRIFDPDPLSNRFDLGQDPLAYVRRQMELTTQTLPKIIETTVEQGEGYQQARQGFQLLFEEYWRTASLASRYPGGMYLSRDHKGESARPPFDVVPAKKQREAMKLLMNSALAAPEIDGNQLNYLGVSRWNHWGMSEPLRLDYPVHDEILSHQSSILSQLLNSITLDRILDNEFKVEEENAYTLAEHLNLLVDGLFSEWKAGNDEAEKKTDAKQPEFSNTQPMISSFRRNLQRLALTRLGSIAARTTGAPADASTLVRMHLQSLKSAAENHLDNQDRPLDDYSRAHLMDAVAQIDRILNAEIAFPSVR